MNVMTVPYRPRLSRADSQARTRKKLLDAAAEVFAVRGYVAATVEDIVRSAGYSRGAFYANFADKADLFLSLVEARREAQFSELADELGTAADDAILPAMAAWFAHRAQDPLDRAAAEFRLAALDHPEHKARLADNMRSMRDLVATMAEHYCTTNEIELLVDHTTFAIMILSVVSGFFEQLRLIPSTPLDILSDALTALWNGLVAQPGNTRT